ncbi:MAG: HDOD domain-containing protein [Pseudomonadota bacterium]
MSEIHQKLEKMVDKMPAFPSSVNQILQLTADINSPPKELIHVIEHDPVLTLKILKLVNSAYFGLSREVTSIKKSVVYIGLNSIKNISLSIAAIGVLPSKNISGYSMNDFLIHSLTTAVISRLLGKSKGVAEQDLGDYFVASLLHDIGQLALAQFFPELFQQACELSKQQGILIHEAEKEVIGEDHAMVGAMLAEKWKLPENLIHCIRYHHRMDEFDQANVMDKSIFVANQVSKLMLDEDKRLSGIEHMPEYIQSWLGMPLEEVAGSFENLDEEMDKTKLFIKLGRA